MTRGWCASETSKGFITYFILVLFSWKDHILRLQALQIKNCSEKFQKNLRGVTIGAGITSQGRSYRFRIVAILKIVLLIRILISKFLIMATKVFFVNREYQADTTVFIVDREYKAQMNIFPVDREYQAQMKVFVVDREYKAKLKVFIVDREYK